VGALDHAIGLERVAGKLGRLDREEVVREEGDVDAKAPGRPDPPARRVVAEDHRPGERGDLADHLAQPVVEVVLVGVELALGQHLRHVLDRPHLG